MGCNMPDNKIIASQYILRDIARTLMQSKPIINPQNRGGAENCDLRYCNDCRSTMICYLGTKACPICNSKNIQWLDRLGYPKQVAAYDYINREILITKGG